MSNVSTLVVDIDAGTQKFIVSMNEAKASVKEFGAAGVSEHKAIAASAKVLEGNLFSNARAMDGFLEKLKLGGIAQSAFPIIGAVALGGAIVETGKKVAEFFKQLQEAPEKSKGAWASLNATFSLSNAEMDATNDRLQQAINKLQGKQQNGLATSLDEARISAMKLGQELEGDLDKMFKLMKEQEPGMFSKLFLGGVSNKPVLDAIGGETGVGGSYSKLQDIDSAEDKLLSDAKARLASATTDAAEKAGQKVIDDIVAGFNSQRSEVGDAVRTVIKDAIKTIKAKPNSQDRTEHVPYQHVRSGEDGTNLDIPAHDKLVPADPEAKAELEKLHNLQIGFDQYIDHVSKNTINQQLTSKKEGLETGAGNDKNATNLFPDRIKKINAEITQMQDRFAAIGQPEAFQVMTKAAGDAVIQIEELNKTLEEAHKANKAIPAKLTGDQENQIKALELKKENTSADGEYQTKLLSTTTSLRERTEAQLRLTDAIGKGYEATRNVSIETAKAQFIGNHSNDPKWIADHQAGISAVGNAQGSEFDAQHGDSAKKSIQSLTENGLLSEKCN